MAWIPIAEELIEEAEPMLQEAGEEIAAEAEVLAGEAVDAAEAGLETIQEAIESLSAEEPAVVEQCPEEAAAQTEAATPEGGFADDAKLQGHFEDHGGDFGATTPEEYEQQANDFINGPKDPSTLEKVRPNGDIVRYDPATDEFGVANPDGTIKTYYKPDPAIHGKPTNLDYFNAQ